MPTYPRKPVAPPNTARSPIREALYDGIKKFEPNAALVRVTGLKQCENEDDVRGGRQHAARNLDLIIQRGAKTGASLDGPNGALQIIDRLKLAVVRTFSEQGPAAPRLSLLSLKDARRHAQAMDSKVDLMEHDLEDMNEAQLEDFAAYCEACARRHDDLALSARMRAHEIAMSRRGARQQLASVA